MVKSDYHKHLSKGDIYDIVGKYLGGDTQKSISIDYDITIKLVYNIVHMKIYKNFNVSAKYPNYWELVEARSSAGGRK